MIRNRRHWAIAAAAFLAAAPVLAGCGAGSDAITNKPYSPTEAQTLKAKGIAISQAFFLGPDSGSELAAGGATSLYLSVVNTNKDADKLVGLGVDPALGVAKVATQVDLPSQQRVGIGQPTPTLTIEGLKKPLRGGESISVQLQFANAGLVSMSVPVITRSREFGELPQAPASAPDAASSATPEPSSTAEPGSTAEPAPSSSASPSASAENAEGGHGEEGH
ncbi:copper chaperone PCu(A)C [Streptosporangium sp. NPDC051022]|uniref:copper chaperone PCu(A)C n=1 Tax=Streptosporangium sp. NPDC051022 TaxID=3155752 RepID=UPI003445BCBA